MHRPVAALLALLAVTACAATEQQTAGGDCFAVDREDLVLGSTTNLEGTQLVCSLDRVEPGAREKYIEQYPQLRGQQAGTQ